MLARIRLRSDHRATNRSTTRSEYGRLLFVIGIFLFIPRPASAVNAVTGVTTLTAPVGNSAVNGSVRISFACDPGVTSVSIRVVGHNSQLKVGQLGSNAFSGLPVGFSAPCGGTLDIGVQAQFEVLTATDFPLTACVLGFQVCNGILGMVTVAPVQYALTVSPIVGSDLVTLRFVRSHAGLVDQLYGLGSPICGPQDRRTLIAGLRAFTYSSRSFPTAGGPLVVYYCGLGSSFGFGTPPPIGYAVGQADPPEPEEQRILLVRAALDDGTPGPAAGVGLPTQARVPLGGFLRLEAIDDLGQELPADFVLGACPDPDMPCPARTLEPGVAPTALFRSLVLLPYTGGHLASNTYQAVHKGTVTITITPSNADISGGTLTVIVEDPLRLGSTGNSVDAPIVEVAHRTGVLPQFIKAQVDQESTARFNPQAYRYEPIGPSISDLFAISRDENFRTMAPYNGYRLATTADNLNPALAAGPALRDEDRDVRAIFFVGCADDGTGGRQILPTDTLISAREIVRCNDRRLKMNWESSAKAAGAARVQRLQDDPFTAQTNLAATYGLMQMSYVTAIAEMKWAGDVSGAKNPSLLFDSAVNHQLQAGSLNIGAAKVAKDFDNVAQGGALTTGELLLAHFEKALGRYNARTGYGKDVVQKIPSYPPVAQAPVLGGVQ